MPRHIYRLNIVHTSLEFIGIVAKSSSDHETHVYIGNPYIAQRPCVHIGVDLQTHESNLYALDYASTCTIDKNMTGGKDGTIPMLHAALQLAKLVDPKLKKLTFTDNSGFYPGPHQHVCLSDWHTIFALRSW